MMGVTVWNETFENKEGYEEALRRKHQGMALAASHNELFLDGMRELAAKLSTGGKEITVDDLREHAEPWIEPTSPGVWGSIFREDKWEFVRWQESRYPSNHARPVRVWRRK